MAWRTKSYGMIDNTVGCKYGNLLLMGLLRMSFKRAYTKRPAITNRREMPEGRLIDRLRAEQDAHRNII
jgi:hypothetical protein